nr:Gag-Pol polyprotein [Haemonchus contortus]
MKKGQPSRHRRFRHRRNSSNQTHLPDSQGQWSLHTHAPRYRRRRHTSKSQGLDRSWLSKVAATVIQAKIREQQGINVRGYFKCTFAIDGRHGSGTCHVADTTSLLGLDWIAQVEPLFDRLIGSIRYSAISDSTLATIRSSLTTRLRKQSPALFAPGLGCCTKTKASLKLKLDATPVFRKARPVPYAVQPRISQEIDRLGRAGGRRSEEEWINPSLRRLSYGPERRTRAALAPASDSRR